MKLVGSKPSPYVRRIRLWLAAYDYDYIELDIYNDAGRQELAKYTPAMKIPVLLDGGQTVYDSGVIFRYLSQKLKRPGLSWEQQNTLSLIDAVNDSFVIRIMLDRSGIDNESDILIANLQRDRIEQTLDLLENTCSSGGFSEWNYLAICLYCMLDWVEFRGLYDLGSYPSLLKFKRDNESRPMVGETNPRGE